jgi:hypothetical protein
MTSIVRADNISTVAGTGTVTLEAGNTLDTSAGLVTPAGHVIQVVSTKNVLQTESSFASETSLMSATITPSSTSSKILVLISANGCAIRSGPTDWKCYYRRGTTYINAIGTYIGINTSGPQPVGVSIADIDTPATTSAVTYTVYGNRRSGTGDCIFNYSDGSNASTITLMEIAG